MNEFIKSPPNTHPKYTGPVSASISTQYIGQRSEHCCAQHSTHTFQCRPLYMSPTRTFQWPLPIQASHTYLSMLPAHTSIPHIPSQCLLPIQASHAYLLLSSTHIQTFHTCLVNVLCPRTIIPNVLFNVLSTSCIPYVPFNVLCAYLNIPDIPSQCPLPTYKHPTRTFQRSLPIQDGLPPGSLNGIQQHGRG